MMEMETGWLVGMVIESDFIINSKEWKNLLSYIQRDK